MALSFIIFHFSFSPVRALDFGAARWVGAITRANARIPEGRTFSGSELKNPDVVAAWAAADTLSRRSIVVRRQFTPRQKRSKISRATVYVCGLGFYELSINGHCVGQSVLAPLWSDYDKTVWYNQYDVTDLCRGASAVKTLTLRVLLGNGFYNEQGGRYHKMKISFGPPTLLLRLHLDYQNGQSEDVVTDDSWQYALSAVTFNSIYGGEDYDARLEDVADWRPVVVQEGPRGTLRPQLARPVRVMETYRVAQALPNHVFDMGQNLAGFPQITVTGRAGQTVRLTPGESLADGHVSQKQTGRPHYHTYTLRGGAAETWHPRFSYYGFRYIEVEGAVMAGEPNPDGLPVITDLRSCFIYNSARKTGEFECSNPLLNDAYWLIDRAVRSNWQGVWTDCPHREKLGWLEQDWLNGEGLLYNYDCRDMLEQTVQNIADAQHPDGAVPTTAPQYTVFPGATWGKPFNESPEWGGAFIMLPWNYLNFYGDDRLVRRHYDQMCRYVDYLHTLTGDSLILHQGLGDWYDYVDSLKAGFARNTSVAFVATAHYREWTRLMGLMARRIGREADARRYALRTDSITQALNRRFFCPETGAYDTGSQCAQAMALQMDGLVPPARREAVLQRLVADIHAHGDRLTTGDVGTRYLFGALTVERPELNELFYKLVNHYGTPGYGYQISQGMTTLTEQWNPQYGSSLNHFMMGHLNNILVPRLLGIGIAGGGSELSISPMPVGDLTWCRGASECAKGRIGCAWRIEGGRFLLDVELPEGTTALVTLPFSRQRITAAGGTHHYEEEIIKNALCNLHNSN